MTVCCRPITLVVPTVLDRTRQFWAVAGRALTEASAQLRDQSIFATRGREEQFDQVAILSDSNDVEAPPVRRESPASTTPSSGSDLSTWRTEERLKTELRGTQTLDQFQDSLTWDNIALVCFFGMLIAVLIACAIWLAA